MSRPFYVTTPIYYVNDEPHIGHAYTTIVADFLSRFHRLAGRDVFFSTGTDEHGTKVAEAAEKAGISEIEFCDRTSNLYVKAWENLSIEYDCFIRTTSKRHEATVHKILDAMSRAKTDSGEDVIYSGQYEGLYCTGCEKFITEKELVDGDCPDHGRPPVLLKEKNYFFRLTAFLPKLKKMIESGELVLLPESRRREVLGLIDQDLPDFSLSRESVRWGIPLSFDNGQVAYVWVDALTNYLSAVGYSDAPDTFARRWDGGEVVHLLAKDILKFHCLYWPAMLMAAGVKLPDTIFTHGFFTVNGEKMSKSHGVKIDPNDMVATYGPDITRYLLLTQFPFGQDGDVKVNHFVRQNNSDLANDLGNLLSRVAKMIMTHFDSRLPEPCKEIEGLTDLMALAEKLPGAAYAHVNEFRIGAAIDEAMTLVRATNKFFNDRAPWKMAKEGKTELMGGVLYACCEVLRIVSVILFPVMPGKIRELRAVLSLDDSTLSLDNARKFFDLQPGTAVSIDQPVFPRLDEKKLGLSKPEDETKVSDNLLDISEFQRVKLKVAEVIAAEPVEGTSKLLKLQIDLGKEKRQVVAGIAGQYTPEKIIGKKVVVVTNLKPAVIRGVESNGMLLAASSGKKLCVVCPDEDLPPGAKIS